jgi:hypothetical protein
MAAQKLKVLIAALAAMVLVLAAGVAYANSSQPTSTTGASGDKGAQVAPNDESDGPGAAEEPGDADEPGDVDGPGDTED